MTELERLVREWRDAQLAIDHMSTDQFINTLDGAALTGMPPKLLALRDAHHALMQYAIEELDD